MFYVASIQLPFDQLALTFEGELFFDNSVTHQAVRRAYSTDASVYQEMPLAVALPKTVNDIRSLILFATEHETTLIARAAGTSLAGQVVGNGIVVDISKYFDKILEINAVEGWVRVQPGVIRDDLNVVLKPYGWMFGPETSTANRAMIGGMIGNNSCGLHSISWGATRDHLTEVKALLSDGSEATFSPLSESSDRLNGGTLLSPIGGLEGAIYAKTFEILSDPENQAKIRKNFPKKTVTRRNSGYALDSLLATAPFGGTGAFNMCKLIAGSEGTLCFITEAKLNLLPLPPAELGLLCIHCHSLHESLLANGIAMKYNPLASELVDKYIMDFTKGHHEYQYNRFFIEGDPAALLMVEFGAATRPEVEAMAMALVSELTLNGLGYAYPLLFGDESKKAWDVRKAGLGLIRNLPGDVQPVNLIEDCAVAVEDLPNYIEDLGEVLKKHEVHASYYAHAGAGELHVEPMVNLKTSEGKAKFRAILADTAVLLKKYNGSLSGEHGDGRLRGEFIPYMMGEEVYALFREVKNIFDPKGIFNRGKIVDTPPMNEFLRYQPDQKASPLQTVFDFSKQESLLRLAEKCSGSGDCRKTHITGGTMCPSYMATRRERDTTRARANMLRHFYTESSSVDATAEETKEILDLCLSCKGCKSECPSSVDISKMKAEFLQSYYDTNGVPFRSRLIANFSQQMRLASFVPWAYNAVFGTELLRRVANRVVGFHPDRTMPMLSDTTLKKWAENRRPTSNVQSPTSRVYLFCDEFTNYNDVEIGQKAILLLEKLGYEVIIPKHVESGRTYLSKGLVKEAKNIAVQNVTLLKDLISAGTPLIGIEPSAILTFRDEYLDLVPEALRDAAQQLAQNALQIEEFIAREIDAKRVQRQQFTDTEKTIKLHGHCHQKALSSLTPSKKMLSLPENYTVQLIPSGCCGMAGSFGYEKEHYELSMQVGELVLFPTVRQQPESVIIAAPGTSCRHQIKDGTGRKAKHPIEILWEALRP
ncbi:FAD-binding and (Fe-S)-binding domain-containing protein [Runella slithyformis]|uniref:D-lactate dehydrogenase (Cytochrome) n=1 Tax=Runella slithyformis (strain ATCC 29530 / DSM 19594 / LMG 11500 / NCIMB 11436 / LSU 4) TaxID=761193 RepID=A0A7U3ZHM8_RUNSL|nr:FAD-binding and (Fe-S)-binding domain-containing protein [Runella slithyformis]AEI47393.1 D-lactate dehydrogenase (cytochrome) [Runella slithyformis DSM 19594]